MKNVFRFGIAAPAIILAFAISTFASNAFAGDCICDSKFTVHAGPAYNKCVEENCSGKVVKKDDDDNGGGGGGGGGIKTKEVWCPTVVDSDNYVVGGMIPKGDECKPCGEGDFEGMVLVDNKCVNECSLTPGWTSCLTWCPSLNEGTGGFSSPEDACLPCEFGTNGVSCLKEAPPALPDHSKQIASILTKLTDIEESIGQPAKPIWMEWWFWILAGLGLINAVLICLVRKMVLDNRDMIQANRDNHNQSMDHLLRKLFPDDDDGPK